jgi:hypothetical protein
MREIIETITGYWQYYSRQTVHIVLYWIALVWIFLHGRDWKKNQIFQYAVWSFLAITGIMFAGKVLLGGYLPFKIFMILPTAVLVAYVGVELAAKYWDTKKKWIIAGVYVIIIQAAIGLKYVPDFLAGAPNMYKISASVIWLDEYVQRVENPFLLAPSEVASRIQEYDAGVRVAYGDGYAYAEGNIEELLASMQEYGCNCILIESEYVDMDYMEEQGYQLVVILEGYHLYQQA